MVMGPDGSDLLRDDDIEWALSQRRVAMIGASDNTSRDSNRIFLLLQSRGFEVIPVNPVLANQGGSVHGVPAVGSLMDIEGEIAWVDIFRRAQALPFVWKDIAERRAAHGDCDLIWGQYEVVDREVAAEARAAGVRVVMDTCPSPELSRRRHLPPWDAA